MHSWLLAGRIMVFWSGIIFILCSPNEKVKLSSDKSGLGSKLKFSGPWSPGSQGYFFSSSSGYCWLEGLSLLVISRCLYSPINRHSLRSLSGWLSHLTVSKECTLRDFAFWLIWGWEAGGGGRDLRWVLTDTASHPAAERGVCCQIPLCPSREAHIDCFRNCGSYYFQIVSQLMLQLKTRQLSNGPHIPIDYQYSFSELRISGYSLAGSLVDSGWLSFKYRRPVGPWFSVKITYEAVN